MRRRRWVTTRNRADEVRMNASNRVHNVLLKSCVIAVGKARNILSLTVNIAHYILLRVQDSTGLLTMSLALQGEIHFP